LKLQKVLKAGGFFSLQYSLKHMLDIKAYAVYTMHQGLLLLAFYCDCNVWYY